MGNVTPCGASWLHVVRTSRTRYRQNGIHRVDHIHAEIPEYICEKGRDASRCHTGNYPEITYPISSRRRLLRLSPVVVLARISTKICGNFSTMHTNSVLKLATCNNVSDCIVPKWKEENVNFWRLFLLQSRHRQGTHGRDFRSQLPQ